MPFAGAALDHRLEAVRRRAKGLEDFDPDGRHRPTRVKSKKLRYAAEFLAPAFGGHARRRARKFLSCLQAMQDTLGQLNDIDVARQKAFGRGPRRRKWPSPPAAPSARGANMASAP